MTRVSMSTLVLLFGCGVGGACTQGRITSDPGRCGSGCWIDGVCYPNGHVNPTNACTRCDVGASAEAWSNWEGAVCDDGLVCNGADSCVSGVCDRHAGLDCDDGIGCNGTESCDEAAGGCVDGVSACDELETCDLIADQCVSDCGCVAAGDCYDVGTVHPTEPCRVCAAAGASFAWADNDGAVCDDGLFCNGADTCGGGSCSEHLGDPCNDGVACNGIEQCSENDTACVAGADSCGATLHCDVATDTCQPDCVGCWIDGVCHADGTVNPDNPCSWCAVAQDNGAWSSHEGLACGAHGSCAASACVCDPGFVGAECATCVRFVDTNRAGGAGDGLSWQSAFQSLQPGIDAAASDHCQVWVAAGTYSTTTDNDRTASFVLAEGVAVYGGFRGDETTLVDRDWQNLVTTLSGDLAVAGATYDNSYHVVIGATGATLDGFTVMDGNANGTAGHDGVGAGLLNVAATMRVENCRFTHNHAVQAGGGMANLDGSAVTVVNCTFNNNNAGRGGGMHNDASPVEIRSCTFSANTASGFAGSQGGGLDDQNGSDAVVIGSRFLSNLSLFGSGMAVTASAPQIDDCLFVENTGGLGNGGAGGGLFVASGAPVLTNCVVAQNASHDGGGIYLASGSVTLNNCTVAANIVDGVGDGMACRATVTVTNSIFWPDTIDAAGCTAVVTNSDLCGFEGGGGNVCIDPAFASTLPTAVNYLHLGAGSPCVDKAGPDAAGNDLDGHAAFDDDSVVNTCDLARDLGAFEYRP